MLRGPENKAKRDRILIILVLVFVIISPILVSLWDLNG